MCDGVQADGYFQHKGHGRAGGTILLCLRGEGQKASLSISTQTAFPAGALLLGLSTKAGLLCWREGESTHRSDSPPAPAVRADRTHTVCALVVQDGALHTLRVPLCTRPWRRPL